MLSFLSRKYGAERPTWRFEPGCTQDSLGAIRSLSCNPLETPVRTHYSGNKLCGACWEMLKGKPFYSLVRRGDREHGKRTNNRYLPPEQIATKLQRSRQAEKKVSLQARRHEGTIDKLFRMQKPAHWDKKRIKELAEDLHALSLAPRDTANPMAGEKRLGVAADMIRNLFFRPKGSMHCESTWYLAKITRLVGSPKVYNLLAKHLGLPHIRSVEQKWALPPFEPGFDENNWVILGELYEALMTKFGIALGSVVCESPGDETRVAAKAQYCQRTDRQEGYCGMECARRCVSVQKCREQNLCPVVHQCTVDPSHQQRVGDDYDAMKKKHDTARLATYARAKMINPMHKELPAMVCLFVGTCNAFTADDYEEPQWREIERLYEKYLRKIIGPLVSHSSDGDARRRKLMRKESVAAAASPDRYGLNHRTFTLTGRISARAEDGRVTDVAGFPSMDYIHCGKKCLNSSNHDSRDLKLGPNMRVHMNQIKATMDAFDPMETGLKNGDENRKGYRAMDWPSLLRTISIRCIDSMTSMVDGSREPAIPQDPSVRGMLEWLKVIRRYVGIFASRKQDLASRVRSAGYVVSFLRRWRLWVMHQPDCTLDTEFITREAFEDALMSCHHAVLMLMAHRDLAPDHPVMLHRTGSDPCEKLFSSLGSFVENKRVYSILEALQTIHSLNLIQFLSVEGDLEIPKQNKRLGQFWEEIPGAAADMTAWLDDTTMLKYWLEGDVEAQDDLTAFDMRPDPGPDALRPSWWTNPEVHDPKSNARGNGIEDAHHQPINQHNDEGNEGDEDDDGGVDDNGVEDDNNDDDDDDNAPHPDEDGGSELADMVN